MATREQNQDLISVDGVTYLSTEEVLRRSEVSRQTLWRWRREGLIPSGHRFRGRRVLFTSEEAEAIRLYANRIEPIDTEPEAQLGLFEASATSEVAAAKKPEASR